ncbi:MAG: DUF1800 domain-containing protein [Saprospiraceae bacterium]|nr:DUF1800 domain-containing protein [Saprospiraceae bacterium]MCB9317818.1 DUF1800 domain-containing protein [Lewinellaceae bacterium]
MRWLLLCSLSLLIASVSGQSVMLGGGNCNGITVLTSSSYAPPNWTQTADGYKTICGDGLDGPRMDASRFLAQATLGADLDLIQKVADEGIDKWLEDELNTQPSYILPVTMSIYQEIVDKFLANGGDSSDVGYRPYWSAFQYGYWQHLMTGGESQKVRERIALALSEILVISINSDLSGFGDGLASYYDIFNKNAFGNYEDILLDVALHPSMGFYLSHLNNPKTIEEENIHPDENFAREIMQLFSIGLYELNEDGSRKSDGSGNWMPTYGQQDIKNLAKVFTGLGLSGVVPNEYVDSAEFGLGIWVGDMTHPMRMYEDWHEPGEKIIVGNHTILSGQTGMQDIKEAIHTLFMHPNVGPFIGKQLIQRLVTSNPSPAYVARVSQAFNNNGQGVRGDMKAVIRAILLDPEARTCAALEAPAHGKLVEPLIRYTQFTQALPIEQYNNKFWNIAYDFWEGTGQVPLGSPSVFNFFLPDYQPIGPISQQGLIAPEYQIHNTKTSVGYINQVNNWTAYNYVMANWEDEPWVILNTDELTPLARDPEVLLNRLDVLFTHGQLTDRTRSIIKSALEQLQRGDYRDDRVRLALYLLLISPDYAIFK